MNNNGLIKYFGLALAVWFTSFAILSPTGLVLCIGDNGHLQIEEPHDSHSVSDSGFKDLSFVGASDDHGGNCIDFQVSALVDGLKHKSERRLISLSHFYAQADGAIKEYYIGCDRNNEIYRLLLCNSAPSLGVIDALSTMVILC